jgi:hypothetical protein
MVCSYQVPSKSVCQLVHTQTVWWSHPPASLLLQKLGQKQVPKQLISRNVLAWIGTQSSMCDAEIVALGRFVYVRVKKKQSCPCARHKAIWRSGGVIPRILHLVSTQRLVISFTLRPFYYPQNSQALDRGWVSIRICLHV